MNYRRLKLHLCLWGFFLVGCGLAAGAAAAFAARSLPPDPEIDTLLRGVEEKYNRLKTLRMHFAQIYREGPQVIREEAGTLYLRKPGQMRWEYEDPAPKLFLTDGRRMMLYAKRIQQKALRSRSNGH